MDELLCGLVGFLVIWTGKVVVTVGSLGQWRGESIRTDEGRTYSAAGSLWFKRDGRRVVTMTGLLFIGTLFYILLALIFIWYFSRP